MFAIPARVPSIVCKELVLCPQVLSRDLAWLLFLLGSTICLTVFTKSLIHCGCDINDEHEFKY